MTKDLVKFLCGLAVIVIVIIALFATPRIDKGAKGVLHEIRTYDMWDVDGNPNMALAPHDQLSMQLVAMPQAPPIMQGETPPQLIKEMGMEIVPITGDKVRITGVMGNSWADRAGLKRDDILLRFNRVKIKGLDHFNSLITDALPEKNYKVKFLREGRVKSTLVTIGEGEMEGFTPIVPVTFMNPIGRLMQQGSSLFQCPQCGNSIITMDNGLNAGPICPACNFVMDRIR